tara:strand:+ start:638 stop:838 length:201 start_codon:yes stop_codon:yes gene_type:complete
MKLTNEKKDGKFGFQVINSWERNVMQVALTHLKEMHEDIKEENPELYVRYSKAVIKTCKELLSSLK